VDSTNVITIYNSIKLTIPITVMVQLFYAINVPHKPLTQMCFWNCILFFIQIKNTAHIILIGHNIVEFEIEIVSIL
jgi:hypothetical protein